MSSSLDVFLRRLRDPRWIPHISSYCDGRCTRCPFTERCWSYALRQHVENQSSQPLADMPQVESEPEAAPEEDSPRTQGWAERHGIDLNDIQTDPSDHRAYERVQQKIERDPLGTRAKDYGIDLLKVMQPLLPAEPGTAVAGAAPDSELANAIEDVWELGLTIAAKVHRAVSSFEHNKDEEIETDPVQNEANGSAKVARLAIVQSLAAWEIVQRAGVIDAGLVEYLVGRLKQVEAELTERFPLAMAFVRPGFDEQIPGFVRPWSIMPDEDEEDEDADSSEGTAPR